MTERQVNTKQELLAAINHTWSARNNALTQLSPTTIHLAWIEALAARAASAQ